MYFGFLGVFFLLLLSLSLFSLQNYFLDPEDEISKKLPKEILFRIFSYLDVVSLCRCAQVSKYWNLLALDGSNWQKIDLFDFQRDIEVRGRGFSCFFFFLFKIF